MAEILLDVQSAPATPSAGTAFAFIDTTAKILALKDDSGTYRARAINASVAAQGAGFSTDTYVTGSGILLPSFGVQAKTVFRWQITASKTAAGTAQPVYTIRIGAAGTTADSPRLAIAGPVQTADADIGTLNVLVTVRSVGAAGVIQGTAWWSHRGTAASSTIGTGFANDGSGHIDATSAAFDNSALGGMFVGLSINGGASAAWTLTQVVAEAIW